MESQDSSVSCLNLPAQAPGNIDLESKLPHMVQESCGLPILSVLKPLPQTDRLVEAFEVTSVNSLCHQQPQLRPAKSGSKFAYDASASCPEQLKLIDDKEKSYWNAQPADLAAPNGEFKTSIKVNTSSMPGDHSFGSWKDGFAETLMPVQLLDGFELQLSEACYKRFIMFDWTGSRGKIIFNPALAYEFSNLYPTFAKVIEEINIRNIASEKETISKLPAVGNSIDRDARFLAYRETVALAFTALQKIQMSGMDGMALNNFGDKFVAHSVGEESRSQLSCNELSQVNLQGSESQLHEDTEDLEALLSSDDDEETSTGHSPSEMTQNFELICMQNGTDVSTGVPAKKRCKKQGCKEEEVDFIPRAIEESVGKAPWSEMHSTANVFSQPTSNQESEVHPECYENVMDSEYGCKEFYGYGTATVPREMSSKSSAAKHGQSCKAFLRQLGSTKRSRKEKIKKTVKLLRSIIPGGDCTNTAVVLEKAIRYLKSLQIKVQRLEAKQNDKR